MVIFNSEFSSISVINVITWKHRHLKLILAIKTRQLLKLAQLLCKIFTKDRRKYKEKKDRNLPVLFFNLIL